jgi:predicted Zn-dependent protease
MARISSWRLPRGASGLWISGEFVYPVEEITVAGNLKDVQHISEIANDLEFRSSVASPTIRIDGLTVRGARGRFVFLAAAHKSAVQ